MKKRILSIMLTTALLLTTVFAGAQGVFAASDNNQLNRSARMSALAVNSAAINAENMNTGNDASPYYVDYDKSAPMYAAIYVPKACTLKINLSGVHYQYGSSVKLKKEPTASAGAIGNSAYISSSNPDQVMYASVPKGGTYYLEFSTTLSGSYQTLFNAYYAPAGGTLKSKVAYYGSSPNNSVAYYKVTAPSNGYLTIELGKEESDYGSFSIKLMNSKKKSLYKNYEHVGSSKDYYTFSGVAKGTYYIAVKSTAKFYGIRSTFTKVIESSGSTKSKAKRLYKGGSTKKGVVTASQGTTSGDWYKFTVKKSQRVNIQFNTAIGGSSGGMKMSLYSGGRSYADATKSIYVGDNGGTVPIYTSGRKTLAPGTYYLKISKNYDGNGYYELKWK